MTNHRRLAILLVLATLSGCTTWRGEPPEVVLTSLEPLPESTLLEQRVRVGLRFLNPNDVELPVRGLDLKLDVNDIRLARGVSNEVFVIPALGEAEASLTASTSTLNLLRQALGLAQKQDLAYRVSGRMFMGGAFTGRLGFENEGTLGAWLDPGGTWTPPDLTPGLTPDLTPFDLAPPVDAPTG